MIIDVRLSRRPARIDRVYSLRLARGNREIGIAHPPEKRAAFLFEPVLVFLGTRALILPIALPGPLNAERNLIVEQDRQIRLQARRTKFRAASSTAFVPSLRPAALIRLRRVGEAVAEHHPPFRQRRQNDLANMLSSRGKHQCHLCKRRKPDVVECSSTSRIFSPVVVPPGSRVTVTAMPRARNDRASFAICVLLPLPSRPSNVMNFPRAATSG